MSFYSDQSNQIELFRSRRSKRFSLTHEAQYLCLRRLSAPSYPALLQVLHTFLMKTFVIIILHLARVDVYFVGYSNKFVLKYTTNAPSLDTLNYIRFLLFTWCYFLSLLLYMEYLYLSFNYVNLILYFYLNYFFKI